MEQVDLEERLRDYEPSKRGVTISLPPPLVHTTRCVHDLELELLDTRLRLVAAIIDRNGVDVDICADAQHEILAARELLRRMAP